VIANLKLLLRVVAGIFGLLLIVFVLDIAPLLIARLFGGGSRTYELMDRSEATQWFGDFEIQVLGANKDTDSGEVTVDVSVKNHASESRTLPAPSLWELTNPPKGPIKPETVGVFDQPIEPGMLVKGEVIFNTEPGSQPPMVLFVGSVFWRLRPLVWTGIF
jgi:hypothetical protein